MLPLVSGPIVLITILMAKHCTKKSESEKFTWVVFRRQNFMNVYKNSKALSDNFNVLKNSRKHRKYIPGRHYPIVGHAPKSKIFKFFYFSSCKLSLCKAIFSHRKNCNLVFNGKEWNLQTA